MAQLPSMWRTELFHPLVVHFPIALLTVGTVAWLVGRLVGREGRWGFLLPAGRALLLIGTLSAWAAVYTGDLADAEVARTLCDPTVVEAHESYAYWMGYLFTGALAVDAASHLSDLKGVWRRFAGVAAGVAMLLGASLLVYVGHLGASIVYQQGAAVYEPAEDCREFE